MVVVCSQSASEPQVTSYPHSASRRVWSAGDTSTTDSPLYAAIVHPQSATRPSEVRRNVPDEWAVNVVEGRQCSEELSVSDRATITGNTTDRRPADATPRKVKVIQSTAVVVSIRVTSYYEVLPDIATSPRAPLQDAATWRI